MSTRAPAKKSPAKKQPPPSKKNLPAGLIVGALVAVIVIVAAVIAIVSSGGDDGDESGGSSPAPAATEGAPAGGSSPGPAATDGAPSAPAGSEFAPVTVSGNALAPFERGNDAALGQTAPTLTGVSFDGSTVSVAPGRPTLLVFLAHWCPHCQAEVPRLVDWNASGARPESVDVVAVATGTDDRRDNYPPSEWLAREGWPFPVLLDDQQYTAAVAMGVSAFPFFALLDENGTVVWRESGELAMDDLTAVITSTLGA